jgi:ATP-dependent DNA ligase
MKPMLAFKDWKRIPFPCYVQPKLNGVRAMWIPGQGLHSRDEVMWNPAAVPHIVEGLERVKHPLDGELYCHGMSLQQINSRIAVKRTKVHADVLKVSYNVFDIAMPYSFHLRNERLRSIQHLFGPHITVVPTVFCNTEQEAELCYRLWRSQNYEGMMYRDLQHEYGYHKKDAQPGWRVCGNKENRWNCLQKRKEWLDIVLPVRGVEEGKDGMRGTCGSLVFVLDGHEFTAGSGLTRQQRAWFWARRHDESIYNINVSLKYEMLSDTGVPLKPTIEQLDV